MRRWARRQFKVSNGDVLGLILIANPFDGAVHLALFVAGIAVLFSSPVVTE